jgi:hypothetical protein
MTANLAATASAAYVFNVGGYPLVGWVSVGTAALQGLLAATLPVSHAARHAASRPHADGPDGSALAETEQAASAYLRMLRTGLAESRHHPDVRRVLLLVAGMVGLTTYDEYFPLVARAHHVDTTTVPLLIAVTVAGQVIGTALTGRSARFGARTIGTLVVLGAALVTAGALVTPYAGFVAIAVGYGLANNAMLVGEARLQETITGPRADC